MKKTYISPVVNTYEMKACELLSNSTGAIHNTEAGQGSAGNGVNFGRGNDGDDW